MTPLRIFISSVQKEFAAERTALRDYLRGDALMRRFFEVFVFEELPARGRAIEFAFGRRDAGLHAPEFRQEGGMFVQTIRRATGQATAQAATRDNERIVRAFRELLAQAGQATGQAAGQAAAALLAYLAEPKTAKEIQDFVGLRHRETFLDNYLSPMLEGGWMERTIPDKPTSPHQKYRLTGAGRAWLERLSTPDAAPQ